MFQYVDSGILEKNRFSSMLQFSSQCSLASVEIGLHESIRNTKCVPGALNITSFEQIVVGPDKYNKIFEQMKGY